MSERFLSVLVYKSDSIGDCTNGGVSSTHDKLLIPHPEGYITEDDIAVMRENGAKVAILDLEIKNVRGEYRCLKPRGETRWCMMGGNFAYSSDSRFRDLSAYPLPIHDRIEE